MNTDVGTPSTPHPAVKKLDRFGRIVWVSNLSFESGCVQTVQAKQPCGFVTKLPWFLFTISRSLLVLVGVLCRINFIVQYISYIKLS